MDMGSTESKAVVDKGGVDHDALLGSFKQVAKVTKVPMATTYPIPGTILI